MLLICALDDSADPTVTRGYSVVRTDGKVWDPAARGFAPPPVAGAVRALPRIAGPDHSNLLLALDADVPDVTGPGQQLVCIHAPAAGGELVQSPIPVDPDAAPRAAISLAVSLGR
jgi:hypothetical protein